MAESEEKSDVSLIVRIFEGQTEYLDWYAFNVKPGTTYAEVFEKLVTASRFPNPGPFKKPVRTYKNARCYVQNNPHKKGRAPGSVEPAVTLPVESLYDAVGMFIAFELIPEEKQQSNVEERNAFTEIMQPNNQVEKLLYPPKWGSTTSDQSNLRSDYVAINHIIDLFESTGAGFRKAFVKTEGTKIVRDMGQAVYELKPHLKKFSSRGITFPSKLFQFDIRNPEDYNNKQAQLKASDLEDISNKLWTNLSLVSLIPDRMNEMRTLMRELALGVQKYVKYLNITNERMSENHSKEKPCRNPTDDATTRKFKGKVCTSKEQVKYGALKRVIQEKEMYEPILINEYLPENPSTRHEFISNLAFPFTVEKYSYHPGSNIDMLHYLWKAYDDDKEGRSNQVTSKLEKEMPVYHTREMRRQFHKRFGLVAKASPAVLTDMYQFLTGDGSAPPTKISKAVRQRLLLLLDSQDPNLIFDMRHQNEGRPVYFKEFYDETIALIEEKEWQAVDDRRHGRITHMAVAMSVADLIEQVKLRKPDIPIPCVETVRLQFQPSNPFAILAEKHTGRFPLKRKVQSRQYSMNSPDGHYAAVLQNYLKHFSIDFKDYAVLVSNDDKCHIPVGEPGVPVATVLRAKKSVQSTNVPLMASDHDTQAKCKLIPSVTLEIDIPDSIDQSFYHGQVHVAIKDQVYQQSTAMRHSAELRQVLAANGSLQKPIRLLYVDGGPDQRITYPSVKLALISQFIIDDLDVLLAVRTAPNQSYKNWVERIMSTLNMALQIVAIERKEMDEDTEKKMKKAKTMDQVRELNIKKELSDALQPIIIELCDLFKRLSLKGKKFMIHPGASEEQINELWDALELISPDINSEMTTTKQLHDCEDLDVWMGHCCIERKYFFMIFKCGEPACLICRAPRLPADIFSRIKQFPDPMPDNERPGHFKPFDKVYGTLTSQSHCPSLRGDDPLVEDSDEPLPCKPCREMTRAYVKCLDCSKPRCIYSPEVLSREDTDQLNIILESGFYVCGGKLIPPECGLRCFVEVGVTCTTPVSANYYTSRKKFPEVCYTCGDPDIMEIDPVERAQYQSIRPVCKGCHAKGIGPKTRRKNRKRKHTD